MKHITNKARLCTLLMVGISVSAGQGFAQTTPAPASVAAPANETVVSDITVVGTAKPANPARFTRLNPTSASSCNFSVTGDTYMQDYIAATTGRVSRDGSPTSPALNTDASGLTDTSDGGATSTEDGYFSETSPLGDASQEGGGSSFFGNYGSTEQTSACADSDKTIAAGRARIARRDKTLPEGYALFDQEKYPEALAMFKQSYNKLAAAGGGTEAALMIGKIYLQGLGMKVDAPEAAVWLERAAGAPFNAAKQMPAFDPKYPEDSLMPESEAAIMLAKLNLVGFGGVPKNPKAARKWFERANYVGYVPAAKTLGDMQYYGYDTPKDAKKALVYYSQAAKLGFVPAQYALAELYYVGAEGVEPNLKLALSWYNEAAKAEHPGALYALALAYDTGEGVAADPQKALAFYKTAAVNGNVDAQSAMGTYFYEGGIVAKDHVAARKWFEAAALQKQSDAMFNLGAMLMKGEGGDKDLVKSWVWFRLAQARKHPNAAGALAAVEKQMSAAEKQAAAEVLAPKKAS